MKVLIIMIPGNPSVPGIYQSFVDQVVADLPIGSEKVYEILHHLGQCNTKTTKRKSVNVYDVIDDHRQSIRRILNHHNADKVILIGHSLGSAVTISLHNELEKDIDQFIVLCPFTGPSPNNIGYLKMFRHPVTRLGMKNLTHTLLLNQKVSQMIFKRWLGDNPFNQHISNEIKKPLYLKNFFSLVGSYIEDFEGLKIQEKLEGMNPKKTFFLFAPDDYWVPDYTKNYLPKGSNFEVCQDIQHDFCLFAKQSQSVSNAISNYLSKNVGY